MNNRRQTIWLVSMLSLMVILSAYYLFTEPVNPSQNADSGTKQTDVGADAAKTSTGGDGIKVTEVDGATDSITDPAAGAADANKDAAAATNDAGNKDAAASTDAGSKDAAAPSDANGKDAAAPSDGAGNDAAANDGTGNASPDAGAVSPNDATVLKEMTNLSGSQYFDELKRTGMERTQKQMEELNKIIADTKNHTPEQAASAYETLNSLDDADQRMTNLEVKLLQDFDNAVVTQDQMSFKIVVQSAKLERKQAVHIIDQAAKELKVKPDRLSVEFVP